MMPWNRSNRRWQFSLGALFGALTIAAFLAAAIAGSRGAPVPPVVMRLATMLVVVGAGLVYYFASILILCSPIFLVIACRKLLARRFTRQTKSMDEHENRSRPGSERE